MSVKDLGLFPPPPKNLKYFTYKLDYTLILINQLLIQKENQPNKQRKKHKRGFWASTIGLMVPQLLRGSVYFQVLSFCQLVQMQRGMGS